VLTLNDVTGTSFDHESVEALKSKVAANAPYVRRAAVIGISGLQRLIYEGVQAFSRRRIPHFETRQGALDWLIQDGYGFLKLPDFKLPDYQFCYPILAILLVVPAAFCAKVASRVPP